MNIKIGETIEYKNQKFVVVNIDCQETVEGSTLMIRLFNVDMANREQQKLINLDETKERVIDMIKKMTESGGLGGIGFGIGG